MFVKLAFIEQLLYVKKFTNVTCTPIFIAALSITAKKQSKCSSTDEWIKMSYTHTQEYYSAIKKE